MDLTLEKLDEMTDRVIATWSEAQWDGFYRRWLNAQFLRDESQRPRSSIPVRADDDDVVLGRLIDHARAHLAGRK